MRSYGLTEAKANLKNAEGGSDSEDDEKSSTDDSNDLFRQVLGQGSTTGDGNSRCNSVSSNCSGSYAHRILCRREGDCRQE
mmetsp:Transcript_11515/g.23760  ORF Transcript_11515/g.23760 Transcript_11515/m.23760 type:complete len:81 (+) Transcript_11515:2724-2966(+)